MKRRVLIFTLLLSSVLTNAQNVDYTAWIYQFSSTSSTPGIGTPSPCYEGNGYYQEYTRYGWIKDNQDNTEVSSGCQPCNSNIASDGDCHSIGTWATKARDNVAATQLSLRIDAWEDDYNLCVHDQGDDCRTQASVDQILETPLEYQNETKIWNAGNADHKAYAQVDYKYSTTTLTAATDNTTNSFSTGGDKPFWGSRGVWATNGSDCATSGTITHGQTSSFSTTITTISCVDQITFKWNVSSEENYDYLRFYVNNVEQASISGAPGWATKTVALDPNIDNTLEWRYTKDGSEDSGLDRGFVDEIVYRNELTWNGSISNEWDNSSNWTPNCLPDSETDVVITTAGSSPVISTSEEVKSVLVNAGAVLTISPNACFEVVSSFINNGMFNLMATSTGYGQYSGPSITATYNQVIGEAGWHTIGSPFTNTTLDDIQFDQNAFLQIGTFEKSNIQYYAHSVYEATPPNTWVNAWGSWAVPSALTESFDGSRGYNLYLDSYFTDAFPVTMSLTGTTRELQKSVQVNQANGGWNLVSNPFTRVMDWESMYNNTSLLNTYYVWDATNQNYATYQVGGTATGGATQYIAPMQSVFVRTSTAGVANSSNVFQTLAIDPADAPMVCAGINPFYKTGDLAVVLKTTNSNTSYSDELILNFNTTYSEGYAQNEDAVKFFSPVKEVPSIYAIVENNACVISGYEASDFKIQQIPLGYSSKINQDIRIEKVESPEGTAVILEDKLENIFYNLEDHYTFKTDADHNDTRFVLHIGNDNIVSKQIKLSEYFNAYQNGDVIQFSKNNNLLLGKAELFNLKGQSIAKVTVDKDYLLPISKLSPGIYVVRVVTVSKVYEQKIYLK